MIKNNISQLESLHQETIEAENATTLDQSIRLQDAISTSKDLAPTRLQENSLISNLNLSIVLSAKAQALKMIHETER